MSHIVEDHRTPDGSLRFIVTRDDDGDVALGFDGFPSHTHGDILASLASLPIDAAIRDFVDALLRGRLFIAISRIEGKIRDVWVTDNRNPDKFQAEGEALQLRTWNG